MSYEIDYKSEGLNVNNPVQAKRSSRLKRRLLLPATPKRIELLRSSRRVRDSFLLLELCFACTGLFT